MVVGLAILTGGVFLVGSNHLTFRRTYRLRTEFDNVAGLGDGAEVRVGGIHEGTIREIDLPNRPDGKVTVQMNLASATRAVIKKDSVASIQAEGVVGDQYVAITFGSNDGGDVKDGDTIPSAPPIEMGAMFKKADDILDQVQSVVRKFNQGTGTVGALINDKSLYQNMNSGVSALQDDAEALKHNFLLKGFFQKRGYEDASELTKNAIPKLPGAQASKKFALDAKDLFEKADGAKLKNEKALKPVGEFLQSNPFGLAVVAGFSGMKGDTAQDRQLSLARAAVVRDYLVKNYRLDDSHLKTIGMGKDADTPDGGAVQILIYR